MIRKQDFILFDLAPNEFSCRGLKYLIFLYIASLLVAAVLSGPIFLSFLNCDNDVCHYIVSKGIDKTFERIRLIFIICMLPIFFKKCGIHSLKKIGFELKNIENIFSWILIGACTLYVINLLEVFIGIRSFSPAYKSLVIVLHRLPKFLFCALIVSVLEEIIFRGVMLRIFYTAFSSNVAIILGALFFAYLHTKIPQNIQISNEQIGIFSGFRYIIPISFWFFYKFSALEFLKITILGIWTSKLVIKYSSLNQAIGLHFGIIFAMLTFNVLF